MNNKAILTDKMNLVLPYLDEEVHVGREALYEIFAVGKKPQWSQRKTGVNAILDEVFMCHLAFIRLPKPKSGQRQGAQKVELFPGVLCMNSSCQAILTMGSSAPWAEDL